MLYHHILDKICVGGPKLSNFKIDGLILQNGENKWTRTAIKPNYFYQIILINKYIKLIYSFFN
jgi:hypothetical protein